MLISFKIFIILTHSKMEHHRTHEPSTWNFKTRLPHCEIWQHSSTHAVAEAYPVQNYERTHSRINRNMPHLVNALGTVYDNRKHQNYLLVQRIPNRLSQVTTLTEAQSLKVMYSVFKGLDELAQIYGIVGITESCICFNQNGKVKIWVNSDLSCVYPIFKQKQNGSSSLSRIVSNVYQIISMIQRKCFNSSFLKPFLKKLSENKIVSYNQAAEQILKIGQLLFIIVQEKPNYNNTKHSNKIEDNGNHRNGIQYQQMIQQLKSLKSNRKDGHSRKFSDHHDIKEPKHRRYQSNFEQNNQKTSSNQTPTNFTLNLNKFSESSTFDNSGSQAHKSAPITPRDDVPPEHKNSISFRTGNQQAPPQASLYQPSTPTYGSSKAPVTFQKKPQKQMTICCPFTTLQNSTTHHADHIMEQTSQFNDSFSIHLKNEEKDILVSGQFQTFGMLEDSAQRCRKYGKFRQAYQSENKVKKSVGQVKDEEISLDKKERYVEGERQFNAKEIQLQIQRRLQRRICDQKRLQIKARTSIYTEDFPQENKLYSKTDPQVFKTNTGRQHKLKTISYHGQGYKQIQPYTYVPSGSSHQIRNEKSPSLAYIDKKYEQYMRSNHLTRQSNQIRLENPRPVYTSPSRHIKQWSTFQNVTNYEQPASKYSNLQHQPTQPTQPNSNRSPAQKINKSAGTTGKVIKSCTNSSTNSHLNSNTNIAPYILSNPNSNTTSSSKFNSTQRNRDRTNLYQNMGRMKENNFYQTDPRFQYRYRVETER